MHSFLITASILCSLLAFVKADVCPEGKAPVYIDYQAGAVPGEQKWDIFPEVENLPCRVIDEAFGFCQSQLCIPVGTAVFSVTGTFASGGWISLSHNGMVRKVFASPTRDRDRIYMTVEDDENNESDPTKVKVTVAIDFGPTDDLAVSGIDIHDKFAGTETRKKIGGFNSIGFADTTFTTTMWMTEGKTYYIDPWWSATPETVKAVGIYYGAGIDESMRIPVDNDIGETFYADSWMADHWASYTEEEKQEHMIALGLDNVSQFKVRDPTSEDGEEPMEESECQDDMSWLFLTKRGTLRSCDWISKRADRRCRKVGINGESANEACPVTCGMCW